jgi:H+/Cl- antiporter ClcA
MGLPGLFKDVNDYHVDPKWVPYTFMISGIGLGGGANLGPEQALGNLGGGIGTYLAHDDPFKFGFDEDDRKLLVLAGMCGALGALFPSPILGVLMIYELGNPPKSMMESIVILSSAAFTGFLIYYAILNDYGNTLGVDLLNAKKYNFIVAFQWDFELWQCGTAFLIGITSGVIVLSAIIVIGITRQIFARIRMRLERNKFLQNIVPPIIGGVIIGAVNYALPCTVGDGNMVIGTIVRYGYAYAYPDGPALPPGMAPLLQDDIIAKLDGNGSGGLDSHILVSTAFAKMFLLGVSMNCGFVGGFVFPTILVGVISGMVCFQLFPYIPLGMCIACFMAAVPSGICPMPFTLAGLAIYLLHLGLYQTVPIFISVITAYTVVCGTGIFTALQQRALKKAREAAAIGKDTQTARNMAEEKNFHISQLRGNGAKNAQQGRKANKGADADVLEDTHNLSPTVSQSNV